MTWHILEGRHRFDPRDARSKTHVQHLGPKWWGEHRHLNPLWETKPRALLYGIITVGGFALALFGAIQGVIPPGSVTLLAYFVLPLGLAALAYVSVLPKFLITRWRLSAEGDTLIYESPSVFAEVLELALEGPFGDVLQRLGVTVDLRGWCVPSAAIARVETGPTADWQPMRRYGFIEKPVPRDEVQASLFMHDGSRYVIAGVHAGREDMARLTHSIRLWLDQQRQATRATKERRPPVTALQPADGFNL